ncbi:MAG: hypothetical protein Q8N03_14660 [Ignavibacteria bacterium]|nr:hypothetical protein [Ignavibacteria bacterium]MDP3829733.1 hypothetical protein [Ignavibacteriaceae bacterium]
MQDTDKRNKNLEWLKSQPLESQLNLFQKYTEIMKILANSLMETSIGEKCGIRYSREKPEAGRYSRWGYNPASIKIRAVKP